jgi:hypothetical protein
MLKYIIIGFLSVLSLVTCSQNFNQRVIDSSRVAVTIDSLRKIYGHNKIIPGRYELAALTALSRFPELDSTKIVFKPKKIKTTLNTRPAVWSLLFGNRQNRKYIIRINKRKKDSLIMFDQVPFNAKIGLLGHEFSHIIDYKNKGLTGVAKRGWTYGNKTQKEQFEKEIDSITINRGLGWQLYDWSEYVLKKSEAKQSYKEFKKEIYLEPDEIKEMLLK